MIFTDDNLFKLHKNFYISLKGSYSVLKQFQKKKHTDLLPGPLNIENNTSCNKDEKRNIEILEKLETQHLIIKNWFLKIIDVNPIFLKKEIGIYSNKWFCISGISNVSGCSGLFCTKGIYNILSSKFFICLDKITYSVYGNCDSEEMFNTGFSNTFISILQEEGLPYEDWKLLLYKEALNIFDNNKKKENNIVENENIENKQIFLSENDEINIALEKKENLKKYRFSDSFQSKIIKDENRKKKVFVFKEKLFLNTEKKFIENKMLFDKKKPNNKQEFLQFPKNESIVLERRKSFRKKISRCKFWENEYSKDKKNA